MKEWSGPKTESLKRKKSDVLTLLNASSYSKKLKAIKVESLIQLNYTFS
jgi:hypothetical protein